MDSKCFDSKVYQIDELTLDEFFILLICFL